MIDEVFNASHPLDTTTNPQVLKAVKIDKDKSVVDCLHSRLAYVSTPTEATDGANKTYVDDELGKASKELKTKMDETKSQVDDELSKAKSAMDTSLTKANEAKEAAQSASNTASLKAASVTGVLEAVNSAASRANEVFESSTTSIKESVASYTKLLEDKNSKIAQNIAESEKLKKELEKLKNEGVINDTTVSSVQTFSSSKITKDFRSKDDSYSKTEVNNALAAKLDKSAQAADSAKLGGKIPAAYCLAEDYYNRNAINTILSNKLDKSLKGVASGLASLDSAGKVPSSQLPSYVDDVFEFATRAAFPATGESGKIYIDMATNRTYRWSGSIYIKIASGEVESINSKTGVVILTKADLALGNVDNTSDANKPVSTATQQALDGKLGKTETAANSSQLDGKASSEYYQRNHANTSKITSVAGTSIDLSQGDNFLLDMNVKATLVLNNPQVGQVGIIRVTNATNITGYDAKIKFRNVPSSLTANETFSYFVLDSENIIMGRA